MFLLQRKYRPLLGLDITTSSVKLIELAMAGGQYRVEAYAAYKKTIWDLLDSNCNGPNVLTPAAMTSTSYCDDTTLVRGLSHSYRQFDGHFVPANEDDMAINYDLRYCSTVTDLFHAWRAVRAGTWGAVLRGWGAAIRHLPGTLRARREVRARTRDPRALDAVITRGIHRR